MYWLELATVESKSHVSCWM